MEEPHHGIGHDVIGNKLLEEHRQLARVISAIEQAKELGVLQTELRALAPLLEAHHEGEEASDGLSAMIADRHPAHTAQLHNILAEHQPLRARVDALLAQVETSVREVCEPALREAAELAALLRDHENRESELLCDAIFTDFGGGD